MANEVYAQTTVSIGQPNFALGDVKNKYILEGVFKFIALSCIIMNIYIYIYIMFHSIYRYHFLISWYNFRITAYDIWLCTKIPQATQGQLVRTNRWSLRHIGEDRLCLQDLIQVLSATRMYQNGR